MVVDEVAIRAWDGTKVLECVKEDRQEVEGSSVGALTMGRDGRVEAIRERVRAAIAVRGKEDAAQEMGNGTVPDGRARADFDLDAKSSSFDGGIIGTTR